jgi:polysaccharide export outer membrane protein
MKKLQLVPRSFTVIGLFVLLMAGFTSCTNTKNLVYFKNLPDSTVVNLTPTVPDERIIENGDQLDISFISKDPELSGIFNKTTAVPVAVTGAGAPAPVVSTPQTGSTYIVDIDGTLEFPVLGKIKASGLTARKLKDTLLLLSSRYIKDPLVDVKHSAFRITILGEVRAPGSYSLPMQRTTILEALAMAGDMPNTAKRYDIHLYRDYNGKRTITKIDMRDQAVLSNKNVFQLRPNDVIYIQPRKGAIFREDFSFMASIVTLVLSITTIGLTIHNNIK